MIDMAGYSFNGLCYSNAGLALIAYKNLYPMVSPSDMTYLVSASVSNSGALSYSLNTRPITSNTLFNRTGTLYLTPCNTPNSDFDLTVAMADFSFFYVAVMIFFFKAKAAGAILEKVRRPLGRG